jgi:hypothetical protein
VQPEVSNLLDELSRDEELLLGVLAHSKPIEESKLGFFSMVYKLNYQKTDFVLKHYPALSSIKNLAELHDRYCLQLSKAGIQIPKTRLLELKGKSKNQVVCLQKAFKPENLCRKLIETSDLEGCITLIKALLTETLKFWDLYKNNETIGFHPTLRNFALETETLHYFDTFPPMNMERGKLNKIMVSSAPVNLLYRLIGSTMMNMVTKEYYQVEPMYTGIIGSCCRLRPEFKEKFMKIGVDYVKQSNLQGFEKDTIINRLTHVPKLNWLWLFARRVFGKHGRSNVR